MKKHKKQRSLSTKLSLWTVLFVFFIFIAAHGVFFNESRLAVQNAAIENATRILDNTVLRVNNILTQVKVATDNTDWLITRHLDAPDSMFVYSRRILQNNPNLNGCSISFEPFYFSERGQYFSAYSQNVGGVIRTTQEGNDHYQYFSMDWYQLPKLLDRPCWTEPFVDYNPEDGSVIKRLTHQGLFDESVWSRGQGWGLYGFTMCYRYTHDKAYLQQARNIARFWLSQPDLPADMVPYWDMRDPAIKTGVGPAQDGSCPRDASAAAIIASALYELATYVDADEATTYRQAADAMLHSLETNYQPEPRTQQGFLLLHSTGNYPAKDEIDVPINYADYYYLEALQRRGRL